MAAGYTVQGSGTPVVLVHGSLSSKSQWRELSARLCVEHRVIALDLHGYGDRPLPWVSQGYSLEHEVALLERVIASTTSDDEAIHLVGHSYGAAVALRAAAKMMPERVQSLILMEPPLVNLVREDWDVTKDLLQVAGQVFDALETGEREAGTAAFVDFWGGPGNFAALSELCRTRLTQRLDKAALDFRAVLGDERALSYYRRVRAPTLLIGGQHSPAVSSAVLRQLQRVLPQCAVEWIDAGHMAPITHAPLFNRLVCNFLRASAPSSPRQLARRLAA